MNHKVKGVKPTLKRALKLKAELESLYDNPGGVTGRQLGGYAAKLGRKEKNRGSEPNWVREDDPVLNPPLSIPNHPREMRKATVKNIIETLLSDIDGWEQYYLEGGNE